MLCKEFKCKEADTCPCCYNGKCIGTGYDAYTTCGCSFCVYNIVEDNNNYCRLKNQERNILVVNN